MISVFVTFLQCLCRFHLFLCHLHSQCSSLIQKWKDIGGFKSSSSILSFRAYSGKLFDDSKHYPLKHHHPEHGSHRRTNESESESDRMNKSQNVFRRGFNTNLTSVRLLELKQNYDAYVVPERLRPWLRRGITFSLLMD